MAGTSQHYEQVTSGSYGARAKTAGVAEYQGYRGMAEDFVHINQALVSGRVGWTSETGAVGRREPNGRFEQATSNGRRTNVDTTGVASNTAEVIRQTSSIWADVEPAKFYPGVGQSDSYSGIAEVMPPAYFGQPNQLRPAASTQVTSSFIGYPLPVDGGTGAAPAPSWNHSTGLWVRAPQALSTEVLPNVSAESWEVGFMHETRGTRPPVGPVGALQLNQVATPPEYRPQATSTPASARTSRQLLKLQRFDGLESLACFCSSFNGWQATYTGTRRMQYIISVEV